MPQLQHPLRPSQQNLLASARDLGEAEETLVERTIEMKFTCAVVEDGAAFVQTARGQNVARQSFARAAWKFLG